MPDILPTTVAATDNDTAARSEVSAGATTSLVPAAQAAPDGPVILRTS